MCIHRAVAAGVQQSAARSRGSCTNLQKQVCYAASTSRSLAALARLTPPGWLLVTSPTRLRGCASTALLQAADPGSVPTRFQQSPFDPRSTGRLSPVRRPHGRPGQDHRWAANSASPLASWSLLRETSLGFAKLAHFVVRLGSSPSVDRPRLLLRRLDSSQWPAARQACPKLARA